MAEVRKDYVLDEWVIISHTRGKRPHAFRRCKLKSKEPCVFCPSKVDKLHKVVDTLSLDKKTWKVVDVINKYPAVELGVDSSIKKDKFYSYGDAFGQHEVIVEYPNGKKHLWDLGVKDIQNVLSMYRKRINELSKVKDVKYVQVFKNSGPEAGTSISHTHSQVLASNLIPSRVNEKIKCVKKYKKCPYCDVVKSEIKSKRLCFQNKNFAAFTPFASRFPYEVWIFPKRHITKFPNSNLLKDFADVLKKVLVKLKKLHAAYNYIIYYSPSKKDNLHFHVEVLPRLTHWAGMEFSGLPINPIYPEAAADFFRKKI